MDPNNVTGMTPEVQMLCVIVGCVIIISVPLWIIVKRLGEKNRRQ
jgi:hypothetical protein